MDIPEYIAALERDGHLLAESASDADLDTPIPTCPGWLLRDLLRHVSSVHRWATRYVVEESSRPVGSLGDQGGPWPDDRELLDWYREGHATLVEALREAPADLQCWTFLRAPSPLAHWARRQAHETAIHRADAESAVGAITAFPSAFATDGVDELLTCFLSRPRGRLRSASPRTLQIWALDADRLWTVHIGPERVEVTEEGGESDCVVRGNASDLYLLLWNRSNPERLQVQGDAGVLHLWRERAHVRWA